MRGSRAETTHLAEPPQTLFHILDRRVVAEPEVRRHVVPEMRAGSRRPRVLHLHVPVSVLPILPIIRLAIRRCGPDSLLRRLLR